MNVRELIKELRQHDPNMPVAFMYHDASYGPQTESIEEMAVERVDKQTWNYTAPDTTSVVVLR